MYLLQVDHVTYSGFRDGRPFTLRDCWREIEGVGNARILAGDGRVVLDRAGEMIGRRYRVRSMFAARRGRVTA